MKRDLEKDLIEIETATKGQLERDNMFTASVLQRCHKLVSELKGYKDLEEQGKLLKLPCAVGDTVYCIYSRYTKCSESNQEFDEYNCQGCGAEEYDSKKEYYAQEQKAYSLDWIVTQIVNKHFGKLVFLTKESAEAALEEMRE